MPRFNNIDGVDVQFTAEEESAWDAEFPEYDPDYAIAVDTREKRDALLAVSDWRAGSDVTMSTAWRNYRQALRDVPSQLPREITWPTEPNA